MITYFESIHIDLWDVVENGDYIPYNDQLNEVPSGQWMEEQKLRFLLKFKAWNVMLCGLSGEEYTKVHNFRSETNVGHSGCNIQRKVTSKEQQTKSPHL